MYIRYCLAWTRKQVKIGAVSLGFPSQVNIDENDNRFCLTDEDGLSVSLTTMVQSCSVQTLSWWEILERMFLTVVLISCLALQSEALFGTPVSLKSKMIFLHWSVQSSTCSRDSQCGAFRRTQCLGTSFIFCFGPSRAYTVRGRCLNRSNFFCDVGSKYPPGPRQFQLWPHITCLSLL